MPNEFHIYGEYDKPIGVAKNKSECLKLVSKVLNTQRHITIEVNKWFRD